jgi:hypothetical protein
MSATNRNEEMNAVGAGGAAARHDAGCGGRSAVFISAVERAGLSTLNEGQKVSFEVVANRRTGKSSAENLRAA